MIGVSVTIIGTGALGSSLARALHEKGIEVYSLFNRSTERLEELTKTIKPKYSASFPEAIGQLGDIIFITVYDSSIQHVANKLEDLSDNFPNKTFAHCSGTKPSAVLSSLKEKRASTAAFHPVQTFTFQSKPDDFRNIYFDIEGDEKATNLLKEIAEKLGADYFKISPRAKPYLHAAGVMASNYLLALMEVSAAIAEMGGIEKEKAINALLPLAQKSMENAVSAAHLEDALSGPVVRGDDETVKKHLELLRENPKIYRLYKELGEETLKLAKRGGRLTDVELSQLANLLKKDM